MASSQVRQREPMQGREAKQHQASLMGGAVTSCVGHGGMSLPPQVGEEAGLDGRRGESLAHDQSECLSGCVTAIFSQVVAHGRLEWGRGLVHQVSSSAKESDISSASSSAGGNGRAPSASSSAGGNGRAPSASSSAGGNGRAEQSRSFIVLRWAWRRRRNSPLVLDGGMGSLHVYWSWRVHWSWRVSVGAGVSV